MTCNWKGEITRLRCSATSRFGDCTCHADRKKNNWKTTFQWRKCYISRPFAVDHLRGNAVWDVASGHLWLISLSKNSRCHNKIQNSRYAARSHVMPRGCPEVGRSWTHENWRRSHQRVWRHNCCIEDLMQACIKSDFWLNFFLCPSAKRWRPVSIDVTTMNGRLELFLFAIRLTSL